MAAARDRADRLPQLDAAGDSRLGVADVVILAIAGAQRENAVWPGGIRRICGAVEKDPARGGAKVLDVEPRHVTPHSNPSARRPGRQEAAYKPCDAGAAFGVDLRYFRR